MGKVHNNLKRELQQLEQQREASRAAQKLAALQEGEAAAAGTTGCHGRSSSSSSSSSDSAEPPPGVSRSWDFGMLQEGKCREVKRATRANCPSRGSPTAAAPSDPNAAATAPPPLGTPCEITTKPPYGRRLQAQPFSHILICDFEATCASGSACWPHEIIEFPVVVLDVATLCVVAEFHAYVRPTRNPHLTAFCTELTGITQAQVDAAETLPEVVARLQQWLHDVVYPLCRDWRARHGAARLSSDLRAERKRFVLDDRTPEAAAAQEEEAMVCFATDGPWDMRHFMLECAVLRDGIEFPPLCYRYLNVRHAYCHHFKTKQVKLTHMLKRLGMTFTGQRHSGISDARNICRVLAELLARGYRMHHVSVIKYHHRGDAFLAENKAAQELLAEYGEEDEPSHDTRQQRQRQGKKGRTGSHRNSSSRNGKAKKK